MALYGQLSTMSLMDLLQWAGINRKSGVFELERNRISKKLMFRSGRVVACYCDDPQSRLGQFLMARGMITADNLREALSRQQSTGDSVGDILEEMGLVNKDQLTRLLSQKAEEMILSLFDWTEAIFRFQEMGSLGPYVIDVNLSVDDILLKGMSRVDELMVIRQVFHSSGIVLQLTGKTMPREIETSSMARRIVKAIDGDRTLAEILLHTNSTDFLVLKFLYNLYNRGVLKIQAVRELGDDSVTIVDPWRSHASGGAPSEPIEFGARLAVAHSVEDQLPEVDAAFVGIPMQSLDPDSEAFSSNREMADLSRDLDDEPVGTPDLDAVGVALKRDATATAGSRGVTYEPEEASSEDLSFSFDPAPMGSTESDFVDLGADSTREDAEQTVDEAANAVRKLALEMEETLTLVPWRENHEAATEPEPAASLETTSDLDQGLKNVKQAFEAKEFGKALDILDVCYRRHAESVQVKEWMTLAERAYVDQADTMGLHEAAVPTRCKKLIGAGKLPPQAAYVLSLIDDVTEIRALSWLAPMRQVEVLRILDRLRATGVIEIPQRQPTP